MPTHGSAATPAVVTSAATMTFPKPTGLANGDYWYIASGWRGTITTTTPTGFEAVAAATGFTGTTAANARAYVFRKPITDAGLEPASVDLTGSANMFGVGFSWRVSGAGTAVDDITAQLTTDTDNNNTVLSPAVTPTKGGTIVYRLTFMNHPTDGFAAGIIDPADAAELFASPAMPSGTQRVSGAIAWEAGPGSGGVSTGTEAWTYGGASWGAALGITIALAGESIAIDAGEDQTVNSGELVILDASGTVGADSITWGVTGGSYPAAHLIPISEGIVHFIAPTGPTDLTLTCTATLGETSDTADVLIHVLPASSGIRLGVIGPTGQATY